ncbi:ParB N-terminal domain-containing protein [Vibrio vulnificus]|uniref:ParB N-terminal domain-containing protein n=2 Tax=Vibrio vulnificus TaxID=672 RepID=UPI001EECD8E3|nr:ParB N-terminal domain-containing protein [Vibrio vulnificus]
MAIGYQLKDTVVTLDELILDANNYRLRNGHIHEEMSDKDMESETVQSEIKKLLAKQKLGELKESIKQNGFLEVDRIVVRKSNYSDNFIVIEGNRRTAAFKALMKDHKESRVRLNEKLINKSNQISVVLISGTSEQIKSYSSTLMGIRHVSGPKTWRGIQSAELIYNLIKEGKSPTQIGAMLGISAMDVNRRLRGYLAYNQMANELKVEMKTNFYTLLLEFLPIRNSVGKEWLGWNEKENKFENKKRLNRLYKAFISKTPNTKPEISNPDDARLFLKAISIEKYRLQIDEDESLLDLGTIDDGKSISKILNDFDKFMSNLNKTAFTADEVDLMKSILKSIEGKLGGERD